MFSGQALAGARRRGSLSQEELARLAGVSMFTVSRLERDLHAPNSRTVEKLAAALGVPVAELQEEA